MSDDAHAKPPMMAENSSEEAFEENEHWSETYKLRAMFLTIMMVLVWAGGWAWVSFVFLPKTLDFREYDENEQAVLKADGSYELKEVKAAGEADDADAGSKIDRSFFSILVYADDGTKNDVNLYIFLVLAGLPLLVVGYRAVYRKSSLSYTLTDHRLIVREGLFAREERQLRLISIRDLAVRQHFVQMIFGVGTVIVYSSDADTPVVEIIGIRDPRAVKERIFKISEEKKVKKEFVMGHA